MAKKRATMKGKGADIFLGTEREEQQEVGREHKPVPQPNQKATFYFPPEILQKLDKTWLEFRRTNKDVKKSDLVATALSAALEKHAANPKNSVLAERLSS